MVVILLLPPYTNNGCDGRSYESSTNGSSSISSSTTDSSNKTSTSTTSTGETAIQTYYNVDDRDEKAEDDNRFLQDYNNNYNNTKHYNIISRPTLHKVKPRTNIKRIGSSSAAFGTSHKYTNNNHKIINNNNVTTTICSLQPIPPPIPPTYKADTALNIDYTHAMPKPLRGHRGQTTLETIPEHPNVSQCSVCCNSKRKRKNRHHSTSNSKTKAASRRAVLNSNYTTNTTNYVRHVTRVNFYDIDTSQVEYDSKDDEDNNNNNNNNNNNIDDDDDNEDNKCDLNANSGTAFKANDCNTVAITKEEEWITKRKTELTTTRQIETHIKRQIVFEDGRVVDDSGPIVSTNTTEDTDKQETETTEKRNLGLPINSVTATPIKSNAAETIKDDPLISNNNNNNNNNVANGVGEVVINDGNATIIKKFVPKPADGLVKECNEKRVISHEEIDDYLETEDVKHLGDFTDKAFVQATHTGVENIEEILLSAEVQQQLEPSGLRIIESNTKSLKTIDSEEVQKRSLLQDNGKIITEQTKTTEHQVIEDKELSDKDTESLGGQENKITIKEADQRYFKQRDEQHMDLVEGGKVVGTEMRYAAETVQMENDYALEKPDDWDSLSDRMRRMRRPYNKASLHPQKTGLLLDRKDALTKRPLDFDREEETRKGETIKWLESHFGSESTASNDSRDDEIDLVEPTKRSYFNVTIKSNQNQATPSTATAHYGSYDRRQPLDIHESTLNDSQLVLRNGSKYYASHEMKKESPPTVRNHFSSKAFHDDLCATVERSQMRKIQQQSSDNYMERNDVMPKPSRHSLSSQFLAKTRPIPKNEIDLLDRVAKLELMDDGYNAGGSRTDLHYGVIVMKERDKRSFVNAQVIDEKESPIIPRNNPLRTYEHFNSLKRDPMQQQQQQPVVLQQSSQEKQTLEKPLVPQRRRSGDKKLRQQKSASPTPKRPLAENRDFREPPPDYSPPSRSRSSSPCTDIRTSAIVGQRYTPLKDPQHSEHYTNFSKKKHYQHTRFARDITPSPPPPTARSAMSSQTTQTTPSSIFTTVPAAPVVQPKPNRVGQAIGNSLRKLVNKFRSASVERKLRLKTKNKTRDTYPASDFSQPHHQHEQNKRDYNNQNDTNSTTTYQQYNVIDSHIGANGTNHQEHFDSDFPITNKHHNYSAQQLPAAKAIPESNIYGNSNTDQNNGEMLTAGSKKNPKQRYYLGEDPYSSNLCGEEHHNEMNGIGVGRTRQESRHITTNGHEVADNYRNPPAHTLGRYQKSNRRISDSTPNLNNNYRHTQTLPHKLTEKPTIHQYEIQKATITRVDNTLNNSHRKPRPPPPPPTTTNEQYLPQPTMAGPLKPARSHPKSLNRSKSFSLHAMNGDKDAPAPIYREKSNINNNNNNRNDYANANANAIQPAHKSNTHLYSSSSSSWFKESPKNALRSPSIVNLISRSQKDLTKLSPTDEYDAATTSRPPSKPYNEERKRQIFFTTNNRSGSNLQNEYKKRMPPSRYQLQPKRSLDSQSSVEINKDTASIIRREEYLREPVNNSSTQMKVRHIDYRK